jgi:hypothetical protein
LAASASNAAARKSGAPEGVELLDRFGLADQPLERPVAALDDARRDARQGRDRAERAAATRELEGGHIVLDAVVVTREGRRPKEVHGPVRADQPAARERRGDRQKEAEDRRGEAESEPTESSLPHRIALLGWPAQAGPAVAAPDASIL